MFSEDSSHVGAIGFSVAYDPLPIIYTVAPERSGHQVEHAQQWQNCKKL